MPTGNPAKQHMQAPGMIATAEPLGLSSGRFLAVGVLARSV
jgi:hypothetical protein